MTEEYDLIRQFYAEEVRAVAALPESPMTDRLLAAFAAVSREKHVGPGPWLLTSPFGGGLKRWRSPNRDVRHLYHNVLVALDEDRGINVGQPSLWAQLFFDAGVSQGERVLQIGAGSGYYTALLAELVGPGGFVFATEIEPPLASMASKALKDRLNVQIEHKDATRDLSGDPGSFDLIIAFAGVTHPLPIWFDLLRPDGRMMLPVTGQNGWGAIVLFKREDGRIKGKTVGPCGFYPCSGARNAQTEKDLTELWTDKGLLSGADLTITMEGDRAVYEIFKSQSD